MIMDFDPARVGEWKSYGQINTIRFNNCFIRCDEYSTKPGLATVTKTTDTGKIEKFGPFDYFNDKLWHIKALITALKDDEMNRGNLAQLVALRMMS